MTVHIHRSRSCEFTRLWEAEASGATNISTFQHQYPKQQVTWSNIDPLAISIVNGAIEFQTDTFSSLQISIAVSSNDTLYRLSWRIQLPQVDTFHVDGQAALHVQLPVLEKVTMTLGSAPGGAEKNEIFLGSSQNTSVVAQLPCISDVTDMFHDVDFVWDKEWMRWYVDDILLLEEFIQDESARRMIDDDSQVVVDLSVTGSRAKLAVKRMSLHSGNSSDPMCAPRYSTSSNCRAQKSFSPRLGSIQGSLSVDEVETYIDEVAAAFPLITKVEELGQSVEKRPLRAVCLGACYAPQEQKIPQALFTGMHHARETLVYTIDILTSDYRNGDLAAIELLSSRQLWFILVVNPDGYAHNEMLRVWEHNKTGLRKSAAPTCDKSSQDAGVDLNRNYGVCFARDTKGSNNDPCGDDYNGPSAFSEPETKAVRDLVERYTSDFSVALNYHSYGKYFNLPFACKDKGKPSEANNSVFVALAQEMARFNGFGYGQSWEESNLYTVNGDTSDWMWQAHGIFAISPEVGPGFETQSVPGFWPSRDDVPQLSSELHYSNLYISRMAGPVYSLAVNGVQLGTIDDGGSTLSIISVNVTISNSGLRSATVELVASVFVNGTSASNAVHLELKAAPDGSESLIEQGHTLIIPYSGDDLHRIEKEIKALYIVVRDAFSCHLFRVAVHFHTALEKTNHTSLQTWTALPLPRCGTCELFFGVSEKSGEAGNSFKFSPICHEIKDVAFLNSIHIRNIDPLTAIAIRGYSSAEPVPASNATRRNSTFNVASSDSTSAEMTSVQQTALLSSILPSVSWSGPVAMIALAGLVLLVIAIVFFRCCYQRNNKKPARTKAASKGQRKVQYSLVDEKPMDSPARDRQMLYYEKNEKNDLVDVECGERSVSIDDEDTDVLKDCA
ncbi:unnamed protein product [Peronospora farinosa]|uniref:Peptidase M14 domain-containing protein n=1 Tax=Peronospora farinosa TaxID=134698 RepID=A0AAV0U9T6_9STRA|nr:unnamed protein product [Peronospora farinosa]